MMAGACVFGVLWNACAPISMPMYRRIGEIATTGITASKSEMTPNHDRMITMMPVAAE
jgi:hypothetical protein